jgi:hypothetical protein
VAPEGKTKEAGALLGTPPLAIYPFLTTGHRRP